MRGSQRVRSTLRHRWALAAIATLLVAGLTVACAPTTTTPAAPLPIDIEQLTDAQVGSQLATEASTIQAAYQDPAVLAAIPAADQAAVLADVAELGTSSGRTALTAQLRTAAFDVPRGLPQRAETADGGDLGVTAGAPPGTAIKKDVVGVLDNPPAASNLGVSVTPDPAGTGACGFAPSPDGITVPSGTLTGGQILTPDHDVFTSPTGGTSVLDPGHLAPSGADPIAGQGPGIEFRGPTLTTPEQMHVRINVQDTKFVPQALYPMISIRPIGATNAQEYRATLSDAHMYCYAGDTNTHRAYLDAWINVPQTEPGFQVIDEVVENDQYFSTPPHVDFSLSAGGPQYFAGADRATVHVGPTPVTSSAIIPHSVGAFGTAAPDGSSTSIPNVLTDTNNQPADDLEQYIRAIIDNTIHDKVDSALAGDIAQLGFFTAQASLTQPLQTSEDLKFTTPQDGFTVTTEPAGSTGALNANIGVTANAQLYTQLLGVPCFGMTAQITANVTANAWADSNGDNTGLIPELRYNRTVDADFSMPDADWLDPTCILSFGLGPHAAEQSIKKAIDNGIYGTFLPVIDSAACLDNPQYFAADGSLINPAVPLPASCLGPDGSFQKLLKGFYLQQYLPSVTIGTSLLQPYIANIDNSWCSASNAPPGCTVDQDLLGKDGVGILADSSISMNSGIVPSGTLGGKFPNVFAPTTTSSVADLTTSHQDGNLQEAGLGVVIDPRIINLVLRDLMQGGNTGTTTNGILDVPPTTITTGQTVSVTPEVAPEVIGLPANATPPQCLDASCAYAPPASSPLATLVAPDLRVSYTTSPGKTIVLSIDLTASVGAQFDASTGKLAPLLENPVFDAQVVSGCQADYTKGYAASYALCGRGAGGSGGPNTLTGVIDDLVDNVVFPILTDSIGGISLPDLSSIVPSIGLDLTNIRFADRGGFLGVYADMKPAPSLGISISPSGLGTSVDEALRFFPSALNINPPWTLNWEIKDATTGQLVKTAPVSTDNNAVEAPLTSFTEHTASDGGTERSAAASLTLTQPNLQISANATYDWYPPVGPPPTGCLSTSSGGTASTAVATTVPGPGPGTNPSGCGSSSPPVN